MDTSKFKSDIHHYQWSAKWRPAIDEEYLIDTLPVIIRYDVCLKSLGIHGFTCEHPFFKTIGWYYDDSNTVPGRLGGVATVWIDNYPIHISYATAKKIRQFSAEYLVMLKLEA